MSNFIHMLLNENVTVAIPSQFSKHIKNFLSAALEFSIYSGRLTKLG